MMMIIIIIIKILIIIIINLLIMIMLFATCYLDSYLDYLDALSVRSERAL